MGDGPVFIIGSPRSGTTVLQASLRENGKLWGGPESHFLTPLLQHLPDVYAYADREPAEEFLLPALGIGRERFFEYLGRGVRDLFDDHAGGRRWVDHTPSYVYFVGSLGAMFPDASFLFLIRDGRQVVESTRHSWWGKGYSHEDACRMWSTHTLAGIEHLESSVGDRMLTIRYEDLVLETARELGRIEVFLGLDHEPACVGAIREREPVHSSFPGESSLDKLLPRWSHWGPEERAAFDAEAGDLLIELGYEADRSWVTGATPHPAVRDAPTAKEPAAVLTDTTARLDRITQLAEQGEPDLATIEAIRLVAAWYDPSTGRAWFPGALSDVLSDLAVLRYSAGDRLGARACLSHAVGVNPGNGLAAENLEAVEAAIAEVGVVVGTDQDLYAKVDNLSHWVVEALDNAERLVGLRDRQVLEVGGAIPESGAAGTGAARWVACDLIATEQRTDRYEVHAVDVGALPFEDDSFDVVFSSCAFEHFPDLGQALAEIRRVLRPGGELFTQWAPVWSGAVGHHLWTTDDDGGRISFSDPVVPLWGHLLLTPHELQTYLTLLFGEATAERAVDFIHGYDGINRLFEGDIRRLFAASGMEQRLLEQWGSVFVPAPGIQAELEALHPGGGDFSTYGFRAVLTK